VPKFAVQPRVNAVTAQDRPEGRHDPFHVEGRVHLTDDAVLLHHPSFLHCWTRAISDLIRFSMDKRPTFIPSSYPAS